MCRQLTIARNAGCMTAFGAGWRKFLDYVGAVIEVDRPSFDAAVLPHSVFFPIWRNKCAVVTQAEIDGQLWCGFPRVLEVETHHPAPARGLMDVAPPGAVRHIQQK